MTSHLLPPTASEVCLFGPGTRLLALMENPCTQVRESVDFLGERRPLAVFDPTATPENAAERCAALFHEHCFARQVTEP